MKSTWQWIVGVVAIVALTSCAGLRGGKGIDSEEARLLGALVGVNWQAVPAGSTITDPQGAMTAVEKDGFYISVDYAEHLFGVELGVEPE